VRRHFFSSRVVEDWNKIPSCLKSAKTVKVSNMVTLISELTWWKTRDMEQAVSRSHRHLLRGPTWATASQPASTRVSRSSGLITCRPLVEHAGLDNLLVHVQLVPKKKEKGHFYISRPRNQN
jgi:hypothetical protein